MNDGFEQTLNDLLAASPAFRQQWAAIAKTPSLYLTMRHHALPMRWRAQTQIRRYEGNVVYVTILIGDRDHARELLAHEIEHVREYLEGKRFRERAALRPDETWLDVQGRVETSRALHAERTVARELVVRRRAALTTAP